MPVFKAGSLKPSSNIPGIEIGASISLILDRSEPGQGPRLHRHAYDETWVVDEGNLTFVAGDDTFEVAAGDIVVVPAHMPHKFRNNGPGRSKMVCIHASPEFRTEWLE